MVALLNLDHLALVEVLLVRQTTFSEPLSKRARRFGTGITSAEQENKLSSWVTIGNLGAGGAMAVATGELIRNVSPGVAALVLGGIIVLPTAVFPLYAGARPDRRLATSFSQFFGDVLNLLKQREVLIAIVLFIAPVATFSLTNFLGGIGDDFHASPHFVSLVGGGGVVLGGTAGCLLFRLIDRLLPLRFLYLAVGVTGSLFTLLLILLPRSPAFLRSLSSAKTYFRDWRSPYPSRSRLKPSAVVTHSQPPRFVYWVFRQSSG